ncbi:uncharacterized protein LOC124886723 [Capsicum annuum]|uniref:uncharacterized protein LOC124886723 n=1 Tax=Capsicum annuum TaxID=4072 RepID=UPI001FB11232|nr:uncharacterized protein LOC124886723 [Capsicum annuum]
MIHLVIHIGEEAILAGPVQGHWMYPTERVLGHLKSYVRNNSAAEGYIAEGFNRPRRNNDDSEIAATSEYGILSKLFPAIGKEFRIEVTRMHRGKRNSSKLVEEYVARQDGANIISKIQWLARGPNNVVRRFKEYNIHGFKFRTLRKEHGLKIQNSGVVMSALTKRFSNGRESVEQSSDDMYYGKLLDIIELNNYVKLKVVLFKCIWVDTTLNKGIKIDQFGITSVKFFHLIHTGAKEIDEPFILATDARIVYYVDDPIDEDWCVVCHMKSRDIYDMGDVDFMDLEEPDLEDPLMEDTPFCEQLLKNIEDLPLVRDDPDGQHQDEPTYDDYESDSNGDDDNDSDGDDEGILD